MVIAIVGASATGKSSLERNLVEKLGSKALISTTTRKPRDGEIEGIHYYFVKVEDWNNLDFAEQTFYAGHHYGIQKKHMSGDSVVVVTYPGAQQLKRFLEDDVVVVVLRSSAVSRYNRMLKDGRSIDEVLKRIEYDAVEMRLFVGDIDIDSDQDEQLVVEAVIKKIQHHQRVMKHKVVQDEQINF